MNGLTYMGDPVFLRMLYQKKHCQLGLKGTERGHDERLSSLLTDTAHIGKGDTKGRTCP